MAAEVRPAKCATIVLIGESVAIPRSRFIQCLERKKCLEGNVVPWGEKAPWADGKCLIACHKCAFIQLGLFRTSLV